MSLVTTKAQMARLVPYQSYELMAFCPFSAAASSNLMPLRFGIIVFSGFFFSLARLFAVRQRARVPTRELADLVLLCPLPFSCLKCDAFISVCKQ